MNSNSRSEPTYQAQGFFNQSTSPSDTEKSSHGQISSHVNEKSPDGSISSHVNEKSFDGSISSHVNEKSSDGQISSHETEKSSDGQISSHETEKSSDGQISSHETEKSSDGQISSHETEKSSDRQILSHAIEEPSDERSPSTPGILIEQPVSTAEDESQASRSDTQPSSCPTKYRPIRFSAWTLNGTCGHAIFFPGQNPYDPNLKYLMVMPRGQLANTMFVLSSVLGIAHAQNRAVCFDARQFPFSKLKGAIQIGWNTG